MSEVDSAAVVDAADIDRIFRAEYGRSVATLIGILGDIDLAEDAVQEAFTVALRRWAADGLPPNPGGWITTTARNRAIDRLRRESRGRELLAEAAVLTPGDAETDDRQETGLMQDDRLRLMFTCCHPALSPEAQVALTLRLLGGLATADVARAFLVTEPAMAQRLARAKRKIKAARIPYRVPEDHGLPDRLKPVLAVTYLVYNAGAGGDSGPELCGEAIRLARLLASLMPDEPEVAGLLALLLLTESRRLARFDDDGALVLLRDQHRRSALYDHLLRLAPTPVVALNRAIAIGEINGPAAALAIIDSLDLAGYQPFHATRADLLRRLGRLDESAMAYAHAAPLAATKVEREFLDEQARRLGGE